MSKAISFLDSISCRSSSRETLTAERAAKEELQVYRTKKLKRTFITKLFSAAFVTNKYFVGSRQVCFLSNNNIIYPEPNITSTLKKFVPASSKEGPSGSDETT